VFGVVARLNRRKQPGGTAMVVPDPPRAPSARGVFGGPHVTPVDTRDECDIDA